MFKYTETRPAAHLQHLIDAYWIMQTGSLFQAAPAHLYADGTTDLFINMGSTSTFLNDQTVTPGTIYFGGMMTLPSVIQRIPNSVFIGIRFKPGAFGFFYKLPLQELTDKIIAFPDRPLFELLDIDANLTQRLDAFFTKKVRSVRNLLPLTKTIEEHKGKITVDFLAQQHHISNRTLERMFNEFIGVTPKVFIQVIRFQQVLKRLRKYDCSGNLAELAFDMGYYDHAHLTNEVKRHSGLNPTELARLINSSKS